MIWTQEKEQFGFTHWIDSIWKYRVAFYRTLNRFPFDRHTDDSNNTLSDDKRLYKFDMYPLVALTISHSF